MVKALILIYIIWGYNWVVMKVSTAYFPPVLFVACRALMAPPCCSWSVHSVTDSGRSANTGPGYS